MRYCDSPDDRLWMHGMHSAVGFLPREEPFGSGRTLQGQTKASSWCSTAADVPGETAPSGLFSRYPPSSLLYSNPLHFLHFEIPAFFAVRGPLLELGRVSPELEKYLPLLCPGTEGLRADFHGGSADPIGVSRKIEARKYVGLKF